MIAAALGVLRVKAGGEPIYLGVGKSSVTCHHTDSVRLFGYMLLEQSHQTTFCRLRIFGITLIQPLQLAIRAVLYLAHFVRCEHRTHDHRVRLSQFSKERLAIVRRAVTEFERILSAHFKQFGAEFPSGRRTTHVGVRHQCFSQVQTAFVCQHGALVHKHHLIVQSQVAHGVLISIVLVTLRELQLLVHRVQHVGYRGISCGLHEHRQGVHHHRNRTQCAAVATSPERRAVRSFLLGTVGRQQLRKSRLHDHAFLHPKALLNGLHILLAESQCKMLISTLGS